MNKSIRDNPFLFACGVPRSGTTLLQRMLNSHPDLAVANDTHFIPRALELTDKTLIATAQRGAPLPLTAKLAANVRDYHRFYRLGLDSQEFADASKQAETYQELVASLYDLYAHKANKPLAGEKTPDYLRRLDLLHGLFPAAKLVHLVRDGRNVALSLRQWAKADKGPGRIALWDEKPIAVSALWWRWLVLAARSQAARIDPAVYCEVHYETLVDEPIACMQSLCQFLELDYSEQMINYHRGKSKSSSSLSAKSAWLAPQPGLRNWQSDMTSDELELFEAIAGDALEEFGFEVANASFSRRTRNIAATCESWWNEHFLPKHEAENLADDILPHSDKEHVAVRCPDLPPVKGSR
jgi:hypothetical protein